MKLIKSLTLLAIISSLAVIGCAKQKSESFSINESTSISEFNNSSENYTSKENSSSLEEIKTSDNNSSSLEEITIDYYNGYYDSLVSWKDGEDLKNQLHAIIRNGYQALSYIKSNKQNYDTNIHADHTKYDFEYLDVIYSKNNNFKTETNKGWQREHAWCASLMCGSPTSDAVKERGRATDFHNLFAANASGNQSRGNKNYGYADILSASYASQFMSENGSDGYSYDEITFEPGDIDKGRLARAIFYMATMYKDDEIDSVNNINMKGLKIVDEPVSYIAGNNCAFAIGNLIDLLEWNEDYDVDYLEMQHNISVYQDTDNIDGYAQGNRNPYIDYPELVDYVYGNKRNEAGYLKDVVASASYLNLNNEDISHYAIKEAKRDYGYGDTLTNNDYQVISVLNNFNYQNVDANNGINHSLNNYTFSENDGDNITAQISTDINNIIYQINLNPMGSCNSGILAINTTGIDKKSPNKDQLLTFNNIDFYFNFVTTYSDVTTNGMTINNISAGGITVGSNSRVLTKLTITTKESYTIDKAYIKAMAGNATSNYSLIIKVGENELIRKTINDSNNWKVFGNALEETLTGQIIFIFSGSASLKINSIAFNQLIA